MLEAHKRPLCRPETGNWASAFAYCRGKCRTSSHSTVHENAYLDTQHHCFSPSGKLPATEQSCFAPSCSYLCTTGTVETLSS